MIIILILGIIEVSPTFKIRVSRTVFAAVRVAFHIGTAWFTAEAMTLIKIKSIEDRSLEIAMAVTSVLNHIGHCKLIAEIMHTYKWGVFVRLNSTAG